MKKVELFSAKPHGGRTTRVKNYFGMSIYFYSIFSSLVNCYFLAIC